MEKSKSSTKWLLVGLAIIFLVVIILLIWQIFGPKTPFGLFNGQSLKNTSPINVSALSSDKEKAIGTIEYPGSNFGDIKSVGNTNQITFETTDSEDGVIGIYSQDLLNRYPNYKVTKKDNVLICSSSKGKIQITVTLNKNGLTGVEIIKDKNF